MELLRRQDRRAQTATHCRAPKRATPATIGEKNRQHRLHENGRVPSISRRDLCEIGHLIGGEEVKGTSGRFGDIFNPNTGDVQAKVGVLADKSEVEKAIANAAAAFPAGPPPAAPRPRHVQIPRTDPARI